MLNWISPIKTAREKIEREERIKELSRKLIEQAVRKVDEKYEKEYGIKKEEYSMLDYMD